MKALIYKEFKLSMHPICYLFVLLFPLMILIPSYPIGVGFIYVLTVYPILFLGANKGQQSNDLLYSVLLPVRKKDIVLARIITVIIIQLTFMLIMSALYPAAVKINGVIASYAEQTNETGEPSSAGTIPGLGLNSFVLVLAIALVGYAVADLLFFPIYYRKGKSIVLSTLLMIIGFVAYIAVFTIVLPYIPGLGFLNELHIGIQLAVFAAAAAISFGLHWLVYRISSGLLEKVDF